MSVYWLSPLQLVQEDIGLLHNLLANSTVILLEGLSVSSVSVDLHQIMWPGNWSQSACDAGINGTAILPGDTSDAYEVSTLGSASNRQISFTVTQSTLGYYWCEISNAVNVSLRTSAITPVLQPTNTSLPLCTGSHVTAIHNTNPECAAVGSAIVYTHTPLPSECVKMTTPTTQKLAGNPTTSIKFSSYTKSPSDSTIIPIATTTPTFQTPISMAPLQVIIVSLGVVVLGLLVGMSLIVVVLAVVVTSLWRQHTN